MAKWPVTKSKKSAKVQALTIELALVEAEEEFRALKEAGQAKRNKEIEKAFKAAKNATEYRKAVAQIAPAVPMKDKLALRALRADYRLNHRKPKRNGAQPGPAATVSVVPNEVG